MWGWLASSSSFGGKKQNRRRNLEDELQDRPKYAANVKIALNVLKAYISGLKRKVAAQVLDATPVYLTPA